MTKKRGGPKSPLTPKQRKIVASARASRIAAETDNPELAAKFPSDYVGNVPPPLGDFEPGVIEALQDRSGPYAEGITAYLEWGATRIWLGRLWPKSPVAHTHDIATLCTYLHSEAERSRLNFPHHRGLDSPALYDQPENLRREAVLTANEVRAAWIAAGRPGITKEWCKRSYRYLQNCIRDGHAKPYPGSVDPQPKTKETI